MTEDRYVASMLGLALGDAAGAKYEGGFFGGVVWKLVGGEPGGLLRWTDDTQMAMGLAESLVERKGLDADHVAGIWARNMEFMRGYGPGARRLLKRIRSGESWRKANRSVFPDGSFGNGGAMRAAPIGLFYAGDRQRLLENAELQASITHAHPLGLEGSRLIALAVALALVDPFDAEAFLGEILREAREDPFRERLELARVFLEAAPSPKEVRAKLGCGIRASESVVTAIYAFVRFHRDFEALEEFVIRLGGDTDTIGAMAGSIFGALRGTVALPPSLLARLEQRETLQELGRSIHRCSGRPLGGAGT